MIETPRLRLRAHGLEDFDALCTMWGDPEVAAYVGGRPFRREETWQRLLRYAGMWRLLGHGYWAVTEKVGGRFIGDVGVMEAKRDMTPSFEGEPEMGWTLMRAAQGKGYASEAVDAAISWAERVLGPKTFVCMIHPDNAPSLRVAEKFGFRERLRTTYHDQPTIQFERRRPLRTE